MKTKIKQDYKTAIKRALTGETTAQDLVAIVKYQTKMEMNDVGAAYVVLMQVAFN